MTIQNKKILLYSGLALLAGSVAYFVYDFFKKPKVVKLGQNSIKLEEENKTKDTNYSFIQQNLATGIKAPDIIKDATKYL